MAYACERHRRQTIACVQARDCVCLEQMCARARRGQTGYVCLSELRFCSSCVSDDRREGRPPYWRREHLLPGVLPATSSMAVRDHFPARTGKATLAYARVGGGCACEIRLKLKPSQEEACLRVSMMSAWLLHNKASVLPESLSDQFQRRARACGFAFGRDQFRVKEMREAIIDHFGVPYLSHVDHMPVGDQGWLESLTSSLPVLHVHRRVLFAEFLSSLRADAHDDAWPNCPNSFADHGLSAPVTLRRRFGDGYLPSCSCGLAFT